jgi:hypothetical protein
MGDGKPKVDGLAGHTGKPARRHGRESNPDKQGARRARSSGRYHSDAPGRSPSVSRREDVGLWSRENRGR